MKQTVKLIFGLSTLPLSLPLSLTACNNQKEPIIEPIDFVTSSWLDVVDACNKLESGEWTEQQFCKRFTFEGQQALSLADFVGKQKIVKINGIDHKAFVLGCQQDYLDEAKEKPVALTFQFDNLISASDGSSLQTPWEPDLYRKGNKNYWDSNLENCLNGSSSVVWYEKGKETPSKIYKKSVYSMIQEGNLDLANGIKDVYRGVNTYDESIATEPKFKLTVQKTKIFELTLGNIFSRKGITDEKSDIKVKAQQELYCNEGQQYNYYALEGKVMDNPINRTMKFDCLIREDCNVSLQNDPYVWWLVSPKLSANIYAMRVYLTGSISDDVVESHYAIAPCFCL